MILFNRSLYCITLHVMQYKLLFKDPKCKLHIVEVLLKYFFIFLTCFISYIFNILMYRIQSLNKYTYYHDVEDNNI